METGISHISAECVRCGICCRAIGFSLITDEDLGRWETQQRTDILHIIESWHPRWMGDHLISSESGRSIQGCPFLRVDGNGVACAIYDTRPAACIDFLPASSPICPLWKPEY